MDGWQPERQKRSFTEMSHSATLSPSPLNFRNNFGDPPTSSFFSPPRFASSPSNDNLPTSDRRRTSHPHNTHLQRAYEVALGGMADRSQSQRPRLEHRASQTVIDLTDDSDDVPVESRSQHSRRPRPPILGRSDATTLRDEIIDLTGDNGDGEPEVVVTSVRPAPRPPVAQNFPPPVPRRRSPSLFIPHIPPRNIHRIFAATRDHDHNFLEQFQGVEREMDHLARLHDAMGANFMDFHFAPNNQPMPGLMNYQNAAFPNQNDARNQKPEHNPPPAAQPGFTRSPTDIDVIICPSCEEELIHNKDVEEEHAIKKGGKAPTKKEREEHPFWVVKECGHVYCNKCYQYRHKSGNYGAVSFLEAAKTTGKRTKVLTCSVDDCGADVKSKDKWVGIFL